MKGQWAKCLGILLAGSVLAGCGSQPGGAEPLTSGNIGMASTAQQEQPGMAGDDQELQQEQPGLEEMVRNPSRCSRDWREMAKSPSRCK